MRRIQLLHRLRKLIAIIIHILKRSLFLLLSCFFFLSEITILLQMQNRLFFVVTLG